MTDPLRSYFSTLLIDVDSSATPILVSDNARGSALSAEENMLEFGNSSFSSSYTCSSSLSASSRWESVPPKEGKQDGVMRPPMRRAASDASWEQHVFFGVTLESETTGHTLQTRKTTPINKRQAETVRPEELTWRQQELVRW